MTNTDLEVVWIVLLMQISFPCSPSRCCWLIHQDVSNSSHLRGQLVEVGSSQRLQSWNADRDILIGWWCHLLSPLPSHYLLPHPATLTFPHGNAAGMHHQHAGERGKGEEELNDSPMWAREWPFCQRSWFKFLGLRRQSVMYDKQVAWV